MGHGVIVHGMIAGGTFALTAPRHEHNAQVIAKLPVEDEWPWLTRRMFSVPGTSQRDVYRTQVIHFGGSFKDDPNDRACWDRWLGKFESLLRNLYWTEAQVHLETEFEPRRTYCWVPTQPSIEGMWGDGGVPPTDWKRNAIEWPSS